MIYAQKTDFFNAAKPRVSGTPEPSLGERIAPDWILDFFSFLADHSAQMFLIALVFIFFVIIRNHVAVQRRQIEKLWVFLAFFLSKRHMMIPLVLTLSSQKNVLTKSQQKTLLDLREELTHFSLKHTPKARFKKERELSKLLFEYFQELEASGSLSQNRLLKKVVQDLEFIDEKLVQLQVLYNRETTAWNKKMKKTFFLRNLLYPFLDFELFDFEAK